MAAKDTLARSDESRSLEDLLNLGCPDPVDRYIRGQLAGTTAEIGTVMLREVRRDLYREAKAAVAGRPHQQAARLRDATTWFWHLYIHSSDELRQHAAEWGRTAREKPSAALAFDEQVDELRKMLDRQLDVWRADAAAAIEWIDESGESSQSLVEVRQRLKQHFLAASIP